MNDILNGRFSIKEIVSEDRLYKAVDIANGNMTAIKKWKGDELFYKTEFQTLKLLQHQCVPQFICSFEENGCKYIAEEWIDGMPLTNSNTLDITLNLAESVTNFISYISDAPYELIHGDVKPSNLLLRNGKIYFLDFENSIKLGDTEAKLREETIKMTDRFFMAPEVLKGNICKQSDIYSIGVLIAWLLGGVGESGLNLSKIPINSKIKAIIKKCVESDPAKRYRDAKELLSEIRSYRDTSSFDIVVKEQKKKTNFSIFVDCNVCFGWELANVAATCFGMKTGIFALTERTQRKLHYYASDNYVYGDDMVEEDITPYIIDIKPPFKSTSDEWLSKGLINKINNMNGKIYCSSSKLIDELQPEKEECVNDFNIWAKKNFDMVIFITDRYDDKPIVKNLATSSDCTIATPLADVDDIDACRNYYEKFETDVLYAAWEFNERSSLPEESIKMMVGFNKYLGCISHSDERSFKRNFVGKVQPIFKDNIGNMNLQYVGIINKLFSVISDKGVGEDV